MPTTNYGTVLVDTSMVPYIRENEVEFLAQNLKPYKIARMFFDEIAVNKFCQQANRLLLDSKKVVTLSRNNATTITANDIVYQGTSNTVNTFNGLVDTFYSANSTIIIRRLEGDFDETSKLFIESNTFATSGITNGDTYANCNVVSFVNKDTADVFYKGEGIVAVQRNNAYATVVGTSGENILLVNKNYVSLNVTGVNATAITSMTDDYKPGDVVFQTYDGSDRYDRSIFKGVVKYYNHLGPSGIGSIAIDPIAGKMNVNSASSTSNTHSFLRNASNTLSLPLGSKEFNAADFAANSNVRSVTNTTVNINVSSWVHRSSVVANVNSPNNVSIIFNSGSGLAPANGNLIYFATGTGVGEFRRIINVTSDGVSTIGILNSAISFSPDTSTHYSIGNFETDAYGTIGGIFHIPSYSTVKFKTGDRLFTITDTARYNDPDYDMRAAAVYSASGVLNTKQRIQTTPTIKPLPELDSDALVRPTSPSDRTYTNPANKSPVTNSTGSSTPRIPLGDGLSQTFFVPKPLGNKTDYGIFCTSIDLFFKDKPASGGFFSNSKLGRRSSMQLPITVKIAEVQNGYPTKNYVASKTIQAKDVKVSELPSTSNSATLTKFTFDDPVYLEPSREYAITIQSDSPDYELYIAQLGEDVLGEVPTRRISEQPYAGSLFRSQNGSTWSPYQNQDLMFVLNKAVFSTSGTATFNLNETPIANTDIDRIMLIASDLTFPVANVEYRTRGIFTANTTQESAGITLYPFTPLEYGLVADASGKNKTTLNRRRVLRGNANSFILSTELNSASTDVSPVVNLERLALHGTMYYINNGGLSNTLISMTNKGAGYNAHVSSGNAIVGGSNTTVNNYAQLYRETFLANNFNVGFYNITVSGTYGSDAVGFAVANTDGSNTVNYIVLASGGEGYIESPTISIASGNATSNVQAYAQINGETDKAGGNMMARYLTREIVLGDGFESGDLRVFMDAIRVPVNDIQVYYKVVSGDDPESISSKRWRRMEKVKDLFSKDGRTIIGLEFRPSLTENLISYTENGSVYPIGGTFKSFQIKVCLLSSDPAIPPKIKNLRISAVPEG